MFCRIKTVTIRKICREMTVNTHKYAYNHKFAAIAKSLNGYATVGFPIFYHIAIVG